MVQLAFWYETVTLAKYDIYYDIVKKCVIQLARLSLTLALASIKTSAC